ncbi:MAG TPA: hypothetical protein PLN52_07105 [Opitutaceae bacterium]|nr:hypothetical protein [Opitutaceae bacterium]
MLSFSFLRRVARVAAVSLVLPAWALAALSIPQKEADAQPRPLYKGNALVVSEATQPDKLGSEGLVALDPTKPGIGNGQQILDPAWTTIVITPNKIFASKGYPGTFSYLPIEKRGKKWVVGKPEPTPYVIMEAAKLHKARAFPEKPVWLGVRVRGETNTVDILDDAGNPVATLDGIVPDGGMQTDGVFMLSEHTLGAWFTDDVGNQVFGVMNRQGVFLSPPIVGLVEFNPSYDYYQPPFQVRAVPLSGQPDRYLPLRLDGTFPLETRPVKGYMPLNPKNKKVIDAWLKEFDENGVSYWGWCSLDLDQETGPIWRSIEKRMWSTTSSYYLAQMRDGRWMPYLAERIVIKKGGGAYQMPDPLLKEPVASADEAHNAVGKVMHERLMNRLKTAPEFNRRVSGSRYYVSASDLAAENPAVALKAASLDACLSAGDWIGARELAQELGGDYMTRYYLAGGRDNGYLPTSHVFWYQLAAQTLHPKLRAEAEAKANSLAEAHQREWKANMAGYWAQKDLENKRAAEAQAGRKAWLLAGGGITLPSEQKPTYAERDRAAQQYMTSFDRYSRGQQTWEPARPSILNK